MRCSTSWSRSNCATARARCRLRGARRRRAALRGNGRAARRAVLRRRVHLRRRGSAPPAHRRAATRASLVGTSCDWEDVEATARTYEPLDVRRSSTSTPAIELDANLARVRAHLGIGKDATRAEGEDRHEPAWVSKGCRPSEAATLEMLKSLTDDEWNAPSGCAGLGGARRRRAHGAASCTASSTRRRCPTSAAAPKRRWRFRSPNGATWTTERGARRVRDVQRSSRRTSSRWRRIRRCRKRCCRWAISARIRCRCSPARSASTTTAISATTSCGRDGPIDRPEPPRDDVRLGATFEWMLAGLPWMSQEALTFLDRPVVLAPDRARRRRMDDRTGRRGRPRPGDRRRRARCGRDHHLRRARLRRVGDAPPPVGRVREDRGRRALRVHRPRRRCTSSDRPFRRRSATVRGQHACSAQHRS